MLVLRVRNVGEFCEADYFEEKKISCSAGRDFLTEKKYSNELHIFMLHTKQMIFVSCYRWHDF